MFKKLLIGASVALIMGQACADVKIADINYTDTVKLGGQELVLNGAGMRKILFIKVYAAGLYLPKQAYTMKNALEQAGAARVRLGLLRDVETKDFVEALQGGLADNTSEDDRKAIASEVDGLIAVMKKIGDVKEGDLIDFEYTPAGGTSVSMNGKVVGEKLGGRSLYDAVLRIWLGDRCIDEDLKEDLLKARKAD